MFSKPASPFNEGLQHSFITDSSISCDFRPCIPIFLARYNFARHESVCKYRPEPKKIPASKICLETATLPLSTTINLRCDIEQKVVPSNVRATTLRNAQSRYGLWRPLGWQNNWGENWIRVWSCRACFERLQTFHPETGNGSCGNIINESVKQKYLSIDRGSANLLVMDLDKVVKNHLFLLRNKQETIRKQLAFARNDKVEPWPSVPDDNPIHLLHLRFCENAKHEPRRRTWKAESGLRNLLVQWFNVVCTESSTQFCDVCGSSKSKIQIPLTCLKRKLAFAFSTCSFLCCFSSLVGQYV